jgi:putative endonuclease
MLKAMAWYERLLRRPPQSLGDRGEAAAARHLRRSGYRILGRNLRDRLGEIDLLAEHRASGTVCIVEVKAAVSEDPPPEVHVNRAKQRKLTILARSLVQRRGLADRPIRFDVIGVVWPEGAREPARLTHHEGAFEAADL